MNQKENVCSNCGRGLQPGQSCAFCTLTDFVAPVGALEPAGQLVPGELPSYAACLIECKSLTQSPITSTKCKIGRDPTNQVVIAGDQFTSRFHAWIVYERDHFFIEDLGSTNGTLLNGSPLINRRPLVPGDLIRMGRTEFTFRLGSGSPMGQVEHPAERGSGD